MGAGNGPAWVWVAGVEVVDVAKRGMVGRAATPVRDCPCLVFDF